MGRKKKKVIRNRLVTGMIIAMMLHMPSQSNLNINIELYADYGARSGLMLKTTTSDFEDTRFGGGRI